MNALKYLNSRLGKTIEQIKRAYLSNKHICFVVCSEPEFIKDLLCSESFFANTKPNKLDPIANIKIVNDKNSFITDNDFDNLVKPHLYVYNNIQDDTIPMDSLTNYVNIVTSLKHCNKSVPNGKVNYLKESLVLIIVKSKPQIPTYIEPYSETITVPFMNESEFKEFVSLYLEETENIETITNIEGYKFVKNNHFLTKLYQNMMGLNAAQIRGILRRNQILLGNIYCSEEDGIYKEKLDKLIKNIKHEFERLINTSRSLSLEDASDEKPAGLDKIDEWIKEIKDQVSNPDDFKKYLLESPKGLIVSGIPGSGKSMMAKYIAHNLGLSLLRFDIGNVGGKYVGDSEKNMDEALELIDTLTPCVLWIDEIEKAFSINDNSHETRKTTFGKLLTWIQEKSSCFIFATSNDISKMPPELFRSGRFDGKFFTFMPSADECANIFDSRIKDQCKKHKDNESKNLQAKPLFKQEKINGDFLKELLNDPKYCLLGLPSGINDRRINRLNKFFTGADIAQLIKIAKNQYLLKYKEYEGDAVFDSEKFKECLIEAVKKIKTFGETDLEKIAKCYAQLAINNFNSASGNILLPFEGYDDLDYKTSKEPDKECLYSLDRVKEGNELSHYKKLKTEYDKCLYIIVRNTINKLANDIVKNISKI